MHLDITANVTMLILIVQVKEAAAALGVGAPLLHAEPANSLMQSKKTKLNGFKTTPPVNIARRAVVRRNAEVNSTNRAVLSESNLHANGGTTSVVKEVQSKEGRSLSGQKKKFAPLMGKGNASTSSALLKSRTHHPVSSVIKTKKIAPSSNKMKVKEEPGVVGDNNPLRGIPGRNNKAASFAKSRSRNLVKHSKPELTVKQERPEIGSKKAAFNAKKHKNPGNRLNPAQKKKDGSKLIAKSNEKAVKVHIATKLAVKMENSLEGEEEVAIEYEEKEESACPYCMKQFSCWEKVLSHMTKVHANAL